MKKDITFIWAVAVVAWALLMSCAALRKSATQPCPPHELASIDARFAAEAIIREALRKRPNTGA